MMKSTRMPKGRDSRIELIKLGHAHRDGADLAYLGPNHILWKLVNPMCPSCRWTAVNLPEQLCCSCRERWNVDKSSFLRFRPWRCRRRPSANHRYYGYIGFDTPPAELSGRPNSILAEPRPGHIMRTEWDSVWDNVVRAYESVGDPRDCHCHFPSFHG
jgi:hypothetical protein